MPTKTHHTPPHLHNDADRFFNEVALEAGISFDEAREATDAVIEALAKRSSAAQLNLLLAHLSDELREELLPSVPTGELADVSTEADEDAAPAAAASAKAAGHELEEIRIERLEQATQAAIDALHALVEDLEEIPIKEPQPGRISAAARHAHQVLLEAWRRDE